MIAHAPTTTVAVAEFEGASVLHAGVLGGLPGCGGSVISRAGGRHVLAFAGCRGALHWAAGVQRALAGRPLRVRIGLHVGDDPQGRTAAKAAEIAGLARAGEVLASRLVRELTEADEPLSDELWFGAEREVALHGLRAIVPLHWRTGRAGGGLDELTEREHEVLGLIAHGLSNRAIAERLVVTRKTVETHVGRIFLKLDLRDEAREHRRVAAALAYLRTA